MVEKRVVTAALLCMLLVFSFQSASAITYVKEIQLMLWDVQFYQGNPQAFILEDSWLGGPAEIDEYGSSGLSTVDNPTGYEYGLRGFIEIEQCDLVSSGTLSDGRATGTFEGGALLTIKGDLWKKSNPGNLYVDDANILVARMYNENWDLTEQFWSGSNDVRCDPRFDIIGGALFTGAGPEQLVLSDFEALFTFVSSGVDTFGSNDYATTESPTMQITEIPEPATLMLLTFGSVGLAFSRKKRKTS